MWSKLKTYQFDKWKNRGKWKIMNENCLDKKKLTMTSILSVEQKEKTPLWLVVKINEKENCECKLIPNKLTMTSILSVEQKEKTPSPLVVLSSTSVGWSSSISCKVNMLLEERRMWMIDQKVKVKVKLVVLSSTSVGLFVVYQLRDKILLLVKYWMWNSRLLVGRCQSTAT